MDDTISRQLFDRARAAIPGGVNSPVRAFNSVGGTPIFMARGAGCRITDEDGNDYVDLVQSWGPLPFGHARAEVLAAAQAALERGSTFGASTRAEIELAEAIIDAVPSIERVRLVSSGTEAAMTAVRLARGATGRDRIIKFAGHYHGHADHLLVAAGSGVATLGIPGSPGITAGAAADTIIVPWNDLPALDAALAEHGDHVAAIICEPLPANMNLVPALDGYLHALRERCDGRDRLLIFDEVISGFRLGRGGAQAEFGVIPDLTVLGKVIGGGFPLAGFGGRTDLMEQLAPAGPVYQAGTLSGNPVAVAAGLAQLALLTESTFDDLRDITAALVDGLAAVFADAGLPAVVRRQGTIGAVLFAEQAPTDYADVQAADHARYAAFFHAMLRRGVYLAPSGYEVLFTCTALDASALDQVLTAAAEAATEIATD